MSVYTSVCMCTWHVKTNNYDVDYQQQCETWIILSYIHGLYGCIRSQNSILNHPKMGRPTTYNSHGSWPHKTLWYISGTVSLFINSLWTGE